MVSETPQKREHERCCCTASIFNLHPFLVVDSFSTKGQHSYFNHEKKQKYEKNTKFTFFHPTLTQFHGSPAPPIHFFHIFKKNGPDVANNLTRTESRYLEPLGVFRALEKKLFFDKNAAGKICKFTRLWLNFS